MIVDAVLTIHRDELSRLEWKRLLSRLTFFDKEQNEVSVFQYQMTKESTVLPRGAWSLIPDKVYELDDRRSKPKMPEVEFNRELREDQPEAVKAMFNQQQGVVLAPPGFGKSSVALAFVAQCQTTTLVVVHTEDIFNQWVEYSQKLLPTINIGTIRGTTCAPGHLTIATAQTLRRYINAGDKFWRQFGCIIIDEAAHSGAETWEWILNTCPAYYRFGLTATVSRADGMSPLIQFLLGPIIHEHKFESKVPIFVVPVKSGFKFQYRGPFDWHRLMNALVTDEGRNQKIADLADTEVAKGNSVLILSRRVEHLVRIQEMMLTGRQKLLIGSHPNDAYSQSKGIRKPLPKERRQIVKDFRRGKIKCLLATQLFDEAMDVPILSRVILTHPGKHDGRIVQQVGRAIRQHPDKKDAVIFDIVDTVGILERQFVARKAAYKSMGIPLTKGGSYAETKIGRFLDRIFG